MAEAESESDAAAGVVSLDPVRLVGLERYLDGLAAGCARGAADVEDHLAGTAVAVPGEVGELRRLGEWCAVQAAGVVRRRQIVEGLPATLPLPAWAPAARAVVEARADDLGPRLLAVLHDAPPDWVALRSVLAQVQRGLHDPAFVSRLALRIGPQALVMLPLAVERSATTAGSRAVPDDVDAAHRTVGDLLARVERPSTGAAARSRWWDALEGFGVEVDDELIVRVEEAGRQAGLGGDVVMGVVRAARALRAAGGRGPAPRLGPVAVVGFIGDLVDAIDDPDTLNVLSAVASGLSAAAPLAGPAAPVAYAGSVLLAFCAWALSNDQDDDERDVRRDDTGTGERRYPSGSASNPNVDTAGVPLDGAFA